MYLILLFLLTTQDLFQQAMEIKEDNPALALSYLREIEQELPENEEVKDAILEIRSELKLETPASSQSFPYDSYSQPVIDWFWLLFWSTSWLLVVLFLLSRYTAILYVALPLLLVSFFATPYVVFAKIDRWGNTSLDLGSFLERSQIPAISLRENLVVYAAPQKDSQIVTTLPLGKEILVTANKAGWYRYNSERSGWISADDIYVLGQWNQK